MTKSTKQSYHVLVLTGGDSPEREVSLRSGHEVITALRKAGHTVTMADPSQPSFDIATATAGIDVVFPIIHGGEGEDGSLQQLLDTTGVPYLGSDANVSALAYDKVRTKSVLAEHGILTPNWHIVDHETFATSDLRESSYVLKPIEGGSSIDMLFVHNPDHTIVNEGAVSALFKKYDRMLIEELVEGQEVTVGMIGDKALPVIQIIPPEGKEFDYENKYNGKTLEIPNPPLIEKATQRELQKIARRVHTVVGCKDLSRTDMIIAENGAIYVLETNTMPGMTKESLLPKAAAAAGIDMTSLMDVFIQSACEGK